MNAKQSVRKAQREYGGNDYARKQNEMLLTCTVSSSTDQDMQPKRQDKDSIYV